MILYDTKGPARILPRGCDVETHDNLNLLMPCSLTLAK